jgi:membrane protease YdiL (CAAX protease family)
MDLSGHTEPPPPLSRPALVLGLYGAIGLTALLLSAGRGDPDIYRIEGTSTAGLLLLSPLLGLLIGGAMVVLTRVTVARYEWARSLHRDFRALLGPLTGREILILAAASSIGEELLFRGALQPWIGIWPQAVLFALLHIGPARRFLPWTCSALLLGVGFGYLSQVTGDLGGPIVAHFTINFLNLHFISRVDFPLPRPPAPLLEKAERCG